MELISSLESAVIALSALAHESRLTIFRTLVQAGPSGMRVGDLGSTLEIPGATLSHHVNQLKTSGLVNATRSGREIILRADYQAMNGLLSYLSENCCQGTVTTADSSGCGPTVCDDAVPGHDRTPPSTARSKNK